MRPLSFPDPNIRKLQKSQRVQDREITELDYQKANAGTVGSLVARVNSIENGLGAGFIDYTDLDAPTPLMMAENVAVRVTRNLVASEANARLSGPWRNHMFWDNSAKLVRARALYDVMATSVFIRVTPDKIGSTLRVAFVADTLEFAAVNMPITAAVGTQDSIRANFFFPARQAFVTNGAKLMLTATAPMTVLEVSPEFYPMSYEL